MPFTPDQIRAGNTELLKLADILEVADDKHKARGEPTYYQRFFMHDCGTPACAAGHWRAFKGRFINGFNEDAECADFALTNFKDCADLDPDDEGWGGEWSELFDLNGCGGAKTSKEAAAYIRGFVARREEALKTHE